MVRIVDEVPEFLLDSIKSGQRMRIVPLPDLPDLEADPADEDSREFQDALAEARIRDDEYLKSIDLESEDAPARLAQAERKLKDGLREGLGMPPRLTKESLSLPKHAASHGISSSYDLPRPSEAHEDGRHTDRDIQTLLLSDVLRRRLSALLTKERTWRDERGISVLHMAFGFLKWKDKSSGRELYSPLSLIPVQIEKKRSRRGEEFWISSDDASQLQGNTILARKLNLEHGIALPEIGQGEGGGQRLEKFFEDVAGENPEDMTWELKRWAVIGVFPSARLAMYDDLEMYHAADSDGGDFASHPIISDLFGGTDATQETSGFGREYDVDSPEIEKKVSCLITDADSSQFSAIVDTADGKNLAVEGPPGSGKSQTIVNTIATFLDAGKKILFVAEKSAALEVVGNRLEAYGLGNFALSLQANRADKTQVIESIRERVGMSPCAEPGDLNRQIRKYKKARDELNSYINILTTLHGKSALSVHEILGRSIKFSSLIEELPDKVKKVRLPKKMINIAFDDLQDILSECDRFEEARGDALRSSDCWSMVQTPNLSRFQADDLIHQVTETSASFAEANKLRLSLAEYGLSPDAEKEDLESVKAVIDDAPESISGEQVYVLKSLDSRKAVETVENYLKEADLWRDEQKRILRHFHPETAAVAADTLREIQKIMLRYDLDSPGDEHLDSCISGRKKDVGRIRQIMEAYDEVTAMSAAFEGVAVSDLVETLKIMHGASKQALSARKKELNDPAVQEWLVKQSRKAEEIQKTKFALDEEFDLSFLPEPEIISEYASVISRAGKFSFMSADYRKAKKFCKSISRSGKFRASHAAAGLRKISKWKKDCDEFCASERMKSICDLRFDGIDTDLTPFLEAVRLFQIIDRAFPKSDHAGLKDFLKYGSSENIKFLPVIDVSPLASGLGSARANDLDVHLSASEDALGRCETDLQNLKTLRRTLVNPEQASKDQIDDLVARTARLSERREALRSDSDVGNLLGALFEAEKTDGDKLKTILGIGGRLAELDGKGREAFLHSAGRGSLNSLKRLVLQVIECDARAHSSLERVAGMMSVAPDIFLAGGRSYSDIIKRMDAAAGDRDGLLAHSYFAGVRNNLRQYTCKPLVDAIMSEDLNNVRDVVDALVARAMAREIYSMYGELPLYKGSLDRLRKQLQQADREVIRLSRERLQSRLYHQARPPAGVRSVRKSELTDMALIMHEISKSRRHISVRNLVTRSAGALLELKPCWMMSPLAVAQYIPQGRVEFDLVIIDEASQMPPEDAIGALIRGRQTMIVGDRNQLPPTSFFRKLLEDEEADEDEQVAEESILDMANACFNPVRRLRWHYRSRHSSLIAFSNKYVYEDDLVIFPSPYENRPGMGVSHEKVGGVYSSSMNPEEANVMVDHIIRFMETDRDRSLGVVVLNKPQQDLLDEKMRYAANMHGHVRDYIERWEEHEDGLEKFFVKNLENVQGDERDVIFIGTVYGPEKHSGRVMQRFGPINGINGKRRLNVLFTRAKERIVTFSSMTSADILAKEETGNPGVYMLKRWLEYSKTGILESGKVKAGGGEPQSEFEEHVIRQIEAMGFTAVPQVGVKGYAIDIGVKHSDWPHGFIIGVECDGATYHSSRSARDRDRLRQEVLEGLGWRLYRIWSTNWFDNPWRETEKLKKVLIKRLNELLSEDRGEG